MTFNYTLLAIGITMGVFGQLSLKHGMLKLKTLNISGLSFFIKAFANFFVLLGIFFYASSTAIWLSILSRMELSLAYPMISAGYILVVLFSKILFKEDVGLARWAGVITIALGVLLVTQSV